MASFFQIKAFRKWIALLMLLLLAGSAITKINSTYAASSPTYSISPVNDARTTNPRSYFNLNGQPGDSIKDAVEVSNSGDSPVKLQIFAVDAETSSNSGEVYNNASDSQKAVGSWITLEKTQLELQPKTKAIVNFTIQIPKGINSGQHIGGIGVQLIDSNIAQPSPNTVDPKKGAINMTVNTRIINPIVLKVGNDDKNVSFLINKADIAQADNRLYLTLNLQNNGNWLVKPKGEVKVMDSTGQTIFTQELTLSNILPQDTIDYPINSITPKNPGIYRVHASLDFGGSAPAVYDGQVEVKAPTTKAASAPSASQVLPGLDKVVNSQAPAAAPVTAQAIAPIASAAPTAVTPVASTENNSLIAGILIGFGAMLLICGLGLGGFMVLKRGKK